MSVAVAGGAGASPRVRASAWPRHAAALAGVWAAILVLFRADAAAIGDIWWNASTYEHCLAIVPILGWLVWLRRDVLAAVRPRGWAAALFWVAAGGVAWLLGQAGEVAVARHLGLAMLLQGAVAALLGRGATRALAFPLGYALFLVPVGDALVPPLQTVTARACLWLLDVAHVPATLDGVFLTTPAGRFKVAEACSGAKFLIAMVALGVLVAHLGFASVRRRIMFLAACVAAPVAANAVRAFATIYVAQWTGVAAAGGFDHVVYGWIFFAVVIAGVLCGAWRRFDRPADAAPVAIAAVRAADARQTRTLPLGLAAAATLALAAAAPLWATLARTDAAPPVASAHLTPPPGWIKTATRDDWQPRYDGAARLLRATWRDGTGVPVDVAAALFGGLGDGRALVGYGRGAVDPDGPWSWAAAEPAPPGWSGERIVGPGGVARIVLTAWRVGAAAPASPAAVKLAGLRVRLTGGDPSAGALLVSAPATPAGRAAAARMAAAVGDPQAALRRIAAGG